MNLVPLRTALAAVSLRGNATIVMGLIILICMALPAPVFGFVTATSKGPFHPEAYAMSPPRYDFSSNKPDGVHADGPIVLQPGDVKTFTFYVQNRFNRPIDVELSLSDIESSNNPVEVLRVVRRSQYGASSWLSIEKPHLHLLSGQKIIQTATLRVPKDIGGGSYYAAISATKAPDESDSGGSAVKSASVLNLSVYLTIAGDARIAGNIESAEAPSFRINGTGSVVPMYVVWNNTGNVTDAVGGRAYIKSIFGNTVYDAQFAPAAVLRGGKRQFATTWSDTPWIGLFRPKVEFVGRNNKMQKRNIGWIVVLPPWYYFVGLLVALSVPVIRWYRRRREWMLYLLEDDEDENWEEAY